MMKNKKTQMKCVEESDLRSLVHCQPLQAIITSKLADNRVSASNDSAMASMVSRGGLTST